MESQTAQRSHIALLKKQLAKEKEIHEVQMRDALAQHKAQLCEVQARYEAQVCVCECLQHAYSLYHLKPVSVSVIHNNR